VEKMQLTRSEARNKAMTILYQIFLEDKNKINYNIDDVIYDNLEIDNDFVKILVNGVISNKEKIDNLANKYLGTWPIDRLGFNDQAIFRIAIYELLFTDTPSVVVINEAIELAKKYSDDNVSKMFNATLDNIYHKEVINDKK